MTEEQNDQETPKTEEVKKDKAVICGTASSTAHMAPVDDPSFFVCALAWRKSAKNPDRIYEMHKMDKSRVNIPPKYIDHLNDMAKKGVEIISCDHIPGVQGVTVYPLQEVIDFLGGSNDGYNNGDYFMSSIAYQLAHLMYEGWKEIHIYGVDLSTESEYHHQRPNLEYLIGMARGMGIRVYIPKQAVLVKGTHRYGYQALPGEGDISKAELKKRLQQYEQQHQEATARFYTLDGAIQVIKEQIDYLDKRAKGIDLGPYSGHVK